MKHKHMLTVGVIVATAGALLSLQIAPVLLEAGTSSHFEGWWLFGYWVTEYSQVYWLGKALTALGYCLVFAGAACFSLSVLLELVDTKETEKA